MAPGEVVALQPALAGVLGEDLHDPAVGARCSSTGSVAACHALPVTSKTASSRLEAVSSGPMMRKLRSICAAITSRS